jgi:hypothetical protein
MFSRTQLKPQHVTTSTRTETVRRPPAKSCVAAAFIPYVIAAALVAAIIYGFLPKPIDGRDSRGQRRPTHRFRARGRKDPYSTSLCRVGTSDRFSPARGIARGRRDRMGKTVLATVAASTASFLDPRSQAEAEARLKAARGWG